MANKKRGYELLAVWCWQFPPQPDLDNILETYLRTVPEKSASYLGFFFPSFYFISFALDSRSISFSFPPLGRLRDVVFGGIASGTPTAEQIEAFIKNFFDEPGPGKRSRWEEEVAKIQDSEYTQEFFEFENHKSLFAVGEEDARLKIE